MDMIEFENFEYVGVSVLQTWATVMCIILRIEMGKFW